MTELLVRETEVLELAQPGVVIINGGGGGGGVSSVSFTSANGFAATITNPTSTPNITLRTTVTGITKGDGTSLSAAVAGTDYLTPTGSAAGLTGLTSGQVIAALGYTPGSGNGTVTSFSFTNGGGFTGTVNTSTTTPTLSLTLQTASASQSGQLSSTDWTTFNNKGNGTVTSFAFTNANGVTGTVSTATTTPTLSISIQTASASQDGLLSSTDWTTFNSKGSGSVTSVSVASANGFGGSVANANTTPAITLTTSVNGLIKGNGTAMSAAVAGTDYLTPTGSAAGLTGLTSTQVTTALGFTPYNSTNPSGYISGNQTIDFTGDATGSGTTSVTLTIPNDTVTFAKMQNVATNKLLGRSSASSGDIEEISIGSGLSLSAGTLSTTGGGSGTVTSFSFTDGNGFTGAVSNSTTTPTLSLTLSQSFLQRKAAYAFNEFLNSATNQPQPWTGTAASSGTLPVASQAVSTGSVTGVVTVTSSTSANSGYSVVTGTSFVIKGGESASLFAAMLNNGSTTSLRFGFGDWSSSTVAAANGIYFECTNLVCDGRTASSSSRSTTGTSFTATAGTFYYFLIEVNSSATTVTYTIFDASGTQQWTNSLSTNIPTTQLMFHGVRCSNSGTTSLALAHLDFMDFTIPFSTARGRQS